GRAGRLRRRRLLAGDPGVELRGGLHEHAHAHVGVGGAAELGALAPVQARRLRREYDRLWRPGTTSRLPPRCGTQNEWMTSGPSRLMTIVRPTGRCSSFAVTTSRSG